MLIPARWRAPALSLILLAASSCGQRQPYVARIGDEKITIDEFQRRARRLLHGGFQSLDSLKQDDRTKLLDAIIAQELLVMEAQTRGYDRDSLIADQVARVGERALIDTLYARKAGSGPYAFTDEEMRAFQQQHGYDVKVHSEQIVCATEDQARAALRELQGGARFAALVPRYSLPRVQERFGPDGDIGWFAMAEMLEELKEPMRTMQIGQLCSQPIKTMLGYNVFRLTGRESVPLEAARPQMEKLLRAQRIAQDHLRYVEGLRQKYHMQPHPEVLQHLAAVPPDQKTGSGPDEALYTWDGGQFTTGDYMAKHRLGRVRHPSSLSPEQLSRTTDNLAGQRIMLAEARSLGYDREPVVQQAVEARRRELLVRQLFRKEGEVALTEIGEDDVQSYYQQHMDRFTAPQGGQPAPLDQVDERIRRALRLTRENEAMDKLIADLRARYKDRIEVHPEVLAKAFAAAP